MTIGALRELNGLAAGAVERKPFMWPSQWMALYYWLSPEATANPGPIDIWQNPVNVGIADMLAEGKRGIFCAKCAQSGVSTIFVGCLGWMMARYGGQFGYFMAKADTMRSHALRRIEPMIEHCDELRKLLLAGRSNHETIASKSFANGSLNLASAGSENNFISEPYSAVFLDEFDKMGIFGATGNDAVSLALSRQLAMQDPKLLGWSTPGVEGAGIAAYVEHDSDRRKFFMECPHCRNAVDFDFLRDVEILRDPETNKRLADTARLLCFECRHEISDAERARMILHAAQSACRWYEAVEFDPRMGWISTLLPAEAAAREYAGVENYSHLLSPGKSLREVARKYCACVTEAQLKVFHNDVLGRGYTLEAQKLTDAHLQRRVADKIRTQVPDGTLWVTCGMDVQGGGQGDPNLVFYFDISAWQADGKKITLEIDRIQGRKDDDYKGVRTFLEDWRGVTPSGAVFPLEMIVCDAGYQTSAVYSICNKLNRLSKSQWACPIIYNSEKAGGAIHKHEAQNEGQGNPKYSVWFTSRDWLVGRAIDRLAADDPPRVELPCPLRPEIVRHYTANIQIEKYDRHGNFMGYMWAKQQQAAGQKLDDDWLQAAGYCEFAAVLLGLDELRAVEIVEAKAAAEKHGERRSANRDPWRRERLNRKYETKKRRGR